MTADDVRGELAAALREHRSLPLAISIVAFPGCSCGWLYPANMLGDQRIAAWEDHRAAALLPGVDRIAGKRAAEALRAMAAELSDSDQYVEIALGGAAYVQTWLRDRAAALDAEAGQ